MTILPAYLQPGDTIGIVCPAGFMERERAQTCIDTLQQWGYTVKTGDTLGRETGNYFSGTDEERLQDLQQLLDDDSVRAILCGRGGYGTGRVIDQLDFEQFRQQPKWIIGFSDITILHAHIYSNFRIASLHAPMAGAFNDGGADGEYVLSLKQALEGKKAHYTCAVHPDNKRGEAVGELVGGNLALLAHLLGTPSELKTKGRILFIEDVGEYLYNVDRMLYQLKRSGKLDKLAGLILGGFSDLKDTTRPFGKTIYEIIRELVAEYDYPVCFDFPVSHDTTNYALKVGVGYKLKVGKNKVTLEE
ncbi:MAG: LD-carboxypeptidase [Candidatus Pseudobacter hemicellulosilyticus]|uniref:LD-carboxypeptidase n=1 Tax=Candidatus Pseudobacter hemicellulosilyticus TaxID=3121375 RepID=A0AAJ6BJB0_9BACT|nr:MAG: LD-carboxypeptidase [Pseudobacter sp.]